MTYELIAGHPALDLVNTLDWRFREKGAEELLKSPSDLLEFAEQSRLHATRPSARTLQRILQLREVLAEILYARVDGRRPDRRSLKALQEFIRDACLQQQVRWKAGRLAMDLPGDDPDLVLWSLALSASDLMLTDAIESVRACDNSECRWLFLDTSKNHTRRWCEMKICGNRMKARRFKAQRKLSPLDGLADT
jgi:predicted RNA-binding Zn ribbon-like protein